MMTHNLPDIINIARQAGEVIMQIYSASDFSIEIKPDNSPLTDADKAANNTITRMLNDMSDTPIVSEENTIRAAGNSYWLIDPLDGTKEFIKRTGEFTVNIALVENGKPVLGVVYAPAIDRLYYGDAESHKAYRQDHGEIPVQIRAEFRGSIPVIATSKSHKDDRTIQLLSSLAECREVAIGSSLKLCMVAEGEAMLYPRFAPTHVWDTAAADAIVRAAGGSVVDANGVLLDYTLGNSTLNPSFVVEAANNTIRWRE